MARLRRRHLLPVLLIALAFIGLGTFRVIASDDFTDVTDDNAFHDDIGWMKDNGVTSGCTTTKYCPTANVTRQQMAKFMHRLSKLFLWAVVNADATLARGSGAVSSSQPEGTGTYAVVFNRDITDCAYIATIGLSGASGIETPGQVSVVRKFGSASSVFVATTDSGGTASNRGIHLAVLCNST